MSEKSGRTMDLRVRKTRRDIQRALLDEIAQKPFRKIRVDQVLKNALVTKQTFYRHFPGSLDGVLDSIEEDAVMSLDDKLHAADDQDMNTGIRVLFAFLNTDDPAWQKLLTDEEYSSFSRKLVVDYFSLDFFEKFFRTPDDADLLPGYLASAATIFRVWKNGGTDMTLGQLADRTAKLFMEGLGAS